jgi:hypothetical protein
MGDDDPGLSESESKMHTDPFSSTVSVSDKSPMRKPFGEKACLGKIVDASRAVIDPCAEKFQTRIRLS